MERTDAAIDPVVPMIVLVAVFGFGEGRAHAESSSGGAPAEESSAPAESGAPALDWEAFPESVRTKLRRYERNAGESKVHRRAWEEVRAAARAWQRAHAGADGESSPANVAWATSLVEKGDGSVWTEFESLDQCVNPADEHVASYSVGIVTSIGDPHLQFPPPEGGAGDEDGDDSAERGGQKTILGAVAEEESGEAERARAFLRMTGELAPAPVRDGKPEVRVIFDLHAGEWDMMFQDGWENESRVRSQVMRTVGDLEISSEEALQSACRVVTAIERYLVSERDDVDESLFVTRWNVRHHLEAGKHDLEDIRERVGGLEDPSTPVLERIAEMVERSRRRLRTAGTELQNDNVEAAEEEVNEGLEKSDEAYEKADRLAHFRNEKERLNRRLEHEARRVEGVTGGWRPFGGGLKPHLARCRKRASEYGESVGQEVDFENVETILGAAENCVTELGERREVAVRWNNYTTYGAGGLVGLLVLVFGGWRVRQYRLVNGALGISVRGQIGAWERKVGDAEDWLATLESEFPQLLDEQSRAPSELDDSTVELVNRAYFMVDRAHEIVEEAGDRMHDAGAFDVDTMREAKAIFDEGSTELTARKVRDSSPYRSGRTDATEIRHNVWFDELRDVFDELQDRLSEAGTDPPSADIPTFGDEDDDSGGYSW